MSSVARRRSIKAVNLKKLHADDIGQLKDTRASELGTIVKCYNHACSVTVKREVAQWYNEQNVAVTKLSRGQQKVYKNLLKFHQIKKDIKRKAYIKKQIEIQEKLRERAALDKQETELRSILPEKNLNDVRKKKELAQKEMRKEKSMIMRSKYQVLPGIGEEKESEENNNKELTIRMTDKSNTQVTFEDQKDIVITPTNRESLLSPELSNLSGRISAPTYSIKWPGKHNENFPHRYIEPPQNISRKHSFTISQDLYSPDSYQITSAQRGKSVSSNKSPNKEPSFVVDVIGKTEALAIHEPDVSDVSLIETVNKANDVELLLLRNDSFAKKKSSHVGRRSRNVLKKVERSNTDSVESRTSDDEENMSSKSCFKTTLSPNRTIDLNPHKVLPSITNILVVDNTLEMKTNKGKKISKKRAQLLDDMNKYHVGILNRSFKLPNYKVPEIQHVTKYTKNSQGSLVPSEQTVKPASDEFKLPSNRKAYLLRKALNNERAIEPRREKKLRDFLAKMSEKDRDPQVTRTKSKTRSGKKEPFHRNKSGEFFNANSIRNNVYAYILGTAQGDVTDVKNCRYLRTQEERIGSRRGKVSSWGHQYPV